MNHCIRTNFLSKSIFTPSPFLAAPPTFVKRLSDQTRRCRDRISLEVSVSDPDAQVIWTKNDRKVTSNDLYEVEASGVTRALVIKRASFDDEARYCVALDSEKSSCNLKILERELDIVKPLEHVECPLEGDAYFETTLTGTDAAPVWKKDGKPLEKSADVDFEEIPSPCGENTTYRMVLKQQQVEDSGKVSFAALGNQCKQNADLTVKDLPLGFTKKLADVNAEEYGTATFEGVVTHKDCTTTWLANDKPIRASDKYNITSKGFMRRLVISNLSLDDNVTIKCKITDGDREAESSAALKTSQFAVAIVTGLTDRNRQVNQETIFTVQLDQPDVDHKWYCDGTELIPSANLKISNSGTTYELCYKRPQPSDAGQLEFRANKDSVKSSCKFTVTDTHGFAKTLEPEYSWEEGAKLESIGCEVDKPSTEVSWWFRSPMFISELDDRKVQEGQDGTLLLLLLLSDIWAFY